MTVQTFETRCLNMLTARLVEEQNRRADIIVKGNAATYEDYKEHVGFLRGLEFARRECDSVETDIRKGK